MCYCRTAAGRGRPRCCWARPPGPGGEAAPPPGDRSRERTVTDAMRRRHPRGPTQPSARQAARTSRVVSVDFPRLVLANAASTPDRYVLAAQERRVVPAGLLDEFTASRPRGAAAMAGRPPSASSHCGPGTRAQSLHEPGPPARPGQCGWRCSRISRRRSASTFRQVLLMTSCRWQAGRGLAACDAQVRLARSPRAGGQQWISQK
jgi:hypothetical protein